MEVNYHEIPDGYRLAILAGKGTYGEVWNGFHKDKPNIKLAIKKLKCFNPLLKKIAMHEVYALKNFLCKEKNNHPNIVCFVDYVEDETHCYIITEFVDGISLDSIPRPKEETIVKIMIDILEALNDLHLHNIVHRDIKPNNIIVNFEPELKATLIDFGLACSLLNKENYKSCDGISGTVNYMDPSIKITGKATSASDIYSLGVTIYNKLTGRMVSDNYNNDIEYLQSNRRISDELKNIISLMLIEDPSERPTTQDILNYFKSLHL